MVGTVQVDAARGAVEGGAVAAVVRGSGHPGPATVATVASAKHRQFYSAMELYYNVG